MSASSCPAPAHARQHPCARPFTPRPRHTQGPDKKLEAMYARVRKHLGSPALVMRVWERLQGALLQRYRRLEEQLERCYPGMQLRPSPEELRELFKTAG